MPCGNARSSIDPVIQSMMLLKRVFRQAKLMEEGAAVLDELAKEPERAPKAVGALAGVATPVAVVVATG